MRRARIFYWFFNYILLQIFVYVTKMNEVYRMKCYHGNPSTTLIVKYSLTEGNEDTDEPHHLCINNIQTNNVLFSGRRHQLGEFNAHLGTENARYT